MKTNELAQAVSSKSGVDPQTTRKVLDSAFAILTEQLAAKEKIQLEGLGSFIPKEGKEPGKKGRTLFKSWADKEGGGAKNKEERKAKKKAKKKARKQTKPVAS